MSDELTIDHTRLGRHSLCLGATPPAESKGITFDKISISTTTPIIPLRQHLPYGLRGSKSTPTNPHAQGTVIDTATLTQTAMIAESVVRIPYLLPTTEDTGP
jgi:hypothetical protein